MAALVFAGIFIVCAAVVLCALPLTKRDYDADRKNGGLKFAYLSHMAFGILLGVVGFLFLIGSMLYSVPAKNVGVVSTFGKVSNNVSQPGLHMTAPWSDVKNIDATVQTDEYTPDNPIVVRTGDGMETNIWLTIRWEINPDAAVTIYRDYRSDDPTEQFRSAVVSTKLKAAVQSVMAEYNPVAQLDAVNAEAGSDLDLTPDVDELSEKIEAKMGETLASDENGNKLANVIGVTVSGVAWSDQTQDRINAFNTEVANTRVARQKEQTAKADADANKILSESVSNDPNVLVSKCFDTINEAMRAGYQLPAGFSCWQGGSSAVVVPSK